MGKKTRKEKIIADLRRKLQSSQFRQDLPLENKAEREPIKNAQEGKKLPTYESATASPQNVSLYNFPVQLIKKDLTKTLFLSILAISLELTLYFIIEKNLFSLPAFLR